MNFGKSREKKKKDRHDLSSHQQKYATEEYNSKNNI